MNKEIKEIIKFKDILNYYKVKQIEPTYCEELITTGELQRLLDYITNLQEQVNEYEELIDIQDKREYHKRYLEERRKEQPNLLYPDYDEIYKRYYEQKDIIDKLQEENKLLKGTKDKLMNCIMLLLYIPILVYMFIS